MSNTDSAEALKTKRLAMKPAKDLFVPEEGWSESEESDEEQSQVILKKIVPKWRTGLKIALAKDSPHHIRWSPSRPEPLFYGDKKTLKKNTYLHMATRKGKQQMVFDLRCAAVKKKDVQLEELHPYYNLDGPEDDTLTFEARFESGNLLCAMQVSDFEYDLILRSDYRTDGWRQWFYFMIGNTRAGVKYRFNILNFSKAESLYNEGMKPLLYSENDAATNGIGWRHTGADILYYRNYVTRAPGCDPTKYMTLSFSCEFPHDRDNCYLAQVYPYTYMDHQKYIDSIMADEGRAQWVRVEREWCKTLAGNKCACLTITEHFDENDEPLDNTEDVIAADETLSRLTVRSAAHASVHTSKYATKTWPGSSLVSDRLKPSSINDSSNEKDAGEDSEEKAMAKKPYIVISARVHPGESPASFMVEGFLDFLTGDSDEAVELRKRFIFKVIPMLNPDGVIIGNSRCHLGGADLNRRYSAATKEQTPTVYALKTLVADLQSQGEVLLFCDIHGHSRRQEVFMFGNGEKETNFGTIPCLQRLLPMLLEQDSTDQLFSMEGCSWVSNVEKQATCRVMFWRELKVVFSYTLESSLCGTTKGYHLNQAHLLQVGRDFCKSLVKWSDDPRIAPGLSPTNLPLNPIVESGDGVCAEAKPPTPKNKEEKIKRLKSSKRSERGVEKKSKVSKSFNFTPAAPHMKVQRHKGDSDGPLGGKPSKMSKPAGRSDGALITSPSNNSPSNSRRPSQDDRQHEDKRKLETTWGKSPARFATSKNAFSETQPVLKHRFDRSHSPVLAESEIRSPEDSLGSVADRVLRRDRVALPRIMR